MSRERSMQDATRDTANTAIMNPRYSFLHFAGEIRNLIYKKVLEEPPVEVKRNTWMRDLLMRAPLANVSRQIRKEFLSLVENSAEERLIVHNMDLDGSGPGYPDPGCSPLRMLLCRARTGPAGQGMLKLHMIFTFDSVAKLCPNHFDLMSWLTWVAFAVEEGHELDLNYAGIFCRTGGDSRDESLVCIRRTCLDRLVGFTNDANGAEIWEAIRSAFPRAVQECEEQQSRNGGGYSKE